MPTGCMLARSAIGAPAEEKILKGSSCKETKNSCDRIRVEQVVRISGEGVRDTAR